MLHFYNKVRFVINAKCKVTNSNGVVLHTIQNYNEVRFVIISNCMKHHTVANYYFVKLLLRFIMLELTVSKAYYFSDGVIKSSTLK